MQKELSRFRVNSEYEELAVVRGNLERITAELETANNETDVAQRMLNKAKKDKEAWVMLGVQDVFFGTVFGGHVHCGRSGSQSGGSRQEGARDLRW